MLVLLAICLPLPYYFLKFPFTMPARRTSFHPLNKLPVEIKSLCFYKISNS